MLDEGPSKDVYHQLDQLSKQNPVFVQSLQSIMTASHREDPGLADLWSRLRGETKLSSGQYLLAGVAPGGD